MKNETIRLVDVGTDNFRELIKLTVTEEQKNFVASNVYSLAEAYANVAEGKYAKPFGIYAGDTPVGFLMIGYIGEDEEPDDDDEEFLDFIPGSYLIWRLMIDKDQQHKGYGKEAMRLALEFIRTFPRGEAKYCWLSYEPENEVARKLYVSCGFKEWAYLPRGWDEIPAVLEL